MNIKEYIASGILELYVAGALSEREMRDVEHVASTYPEVAEELKAIEDTLHKLTNELRGTPTDESKNKIISQVKLNTAPVIRNDSSSTNDSVEKIERVEKVDTLPKEKSKKSTLSYFVTIGAFLLLVLSISTTYYVWKRWEQTKSELGILKNTYKDTMASLSTLQDTYTENRKILEMLRNPDFTKLHLKGTTKYPTVSAVIYWNKQTKRVLIDLINLPPTDTQHSYQLWAIVTGKPVDLGIFSSSESISGMIEMKQIENANSFAVTLEPKGGSVNPTLSQLYLKTQI